jgi:hypothetical protein
MTDRSNVSTNVFIDKGFPKGKVFCTNFLRSSDFSVEILKKLVSRGKSNSKNELAESIAESLENQEISNDEVLLKFVQQPRKWLSFKIGKCKYYPTCKSSEILLTEFGDDDWYGPIKNSNFPQTWYVRTLSVPFYEQGVYQADQHPANDFSINHATVATYRIRWIVVAEIGANHLALSWRGFSYNELTPGSVSSEVNSLTQFPYWTYIPKFFEEITKKCDTTWDYPLLHELVLKRIWDRYLNDPTYIWRHLRIRADNQGVALNVHSTGACDREKLQMRGLQALSKKLASTALSVISVQETPERISLIESALLGTLIQDWGAKSYEFSLKRNWSVFYHEDENVESYIDNVNEHLFRAHIYFSVGGKMSCQDSFQHLHCFTQDYGGSNRALDFLLSKLAVEENSNTEDFNIF